MAIVADRGRDSARIDKSLTTPASAKRLFVTPVIAFLGSSSVASAVSTLPDIGWNISPFGQLPALCPQVEIRQSHVFGYSGETSTTLKARMNLIAALNPVPSAVVVQVTANDFFSLPASKSIENYTDIVKYFHGLGILTIFAIMHPISAYSTAAVLERAITVQNWVRNVAPTLMARVIDISSVTTDRASDPPTYKTDFSLDGTHLTPLGARVALFAMQDAINHLFPPRLNVPAALGDKWSATNPEGYLTANPTMAGINGLLNGGANAGVPANVNVVNSLGASVTCVPTKITLANGNEAMRLTLGGTLLTTDSNPLFLGIDWNWIAGGREALLNKSLVIGEARVTMNVPTGLSDYVFRIVPNDSGSPGRRVYSGSLAQNMEIPSIGTFTIRTPVCEIISAAPTMANRLIFWRKATTPANVAISGTIDIEYGGVKPLPSTYYGTL